MTDDEFAREIGEAARRIAGDRAPDTLRLRVAAVSAAKPLGVPRARFRGWSLAVSVGLIVLITSAGVALLATRGLDPTGTLSPSAPADAARVSASPIKTAFEATPSPRASTPAASGAASFPGDVPPDWQVVTPRIWTAPVGPRSFLSNAPISDPCLIVFKEGDACWRPLAVLPPDGILVTVSGSAVIRPTNQPSAVTVMPVEPLCASLGGERALGANVQGAVVAACLRGPELDANEAAFRALVASMAKPVGRPSPTP